MKLPRVPSLIAFVTAISLGLSAVAVHAQLILSVDVNAGSGSPSPTQSGYTNWDISTSNIAGPFVKTVTGLNPSLTSGSVTATLYSGGTLSGTGNLNARDRSTPSTDTGSFTYSSLYRDFVNAAATGPISIEFSGLNANTTYILTLYGYDNSNSRTLTYAEFTGGVVGSASDSVTWAAGATFDGTTPNDIYAGQLTLTSDSAGTVAVRISANSGAALLNGFQIAAVPEPSAVVLAGVFLVIGVATRRRRLTH